MSKSKKSPKSMPRQLPRPLDEVQRFLIFQNYNWGSIEGLPYTQHNRKWAKDEVLEGTIGHVDLIDGGHAISCYNEQGIQLFAIGRNLPWDWRYTKDVITVEVSKTARIPSELGSVPYTEYDTFKIFIRSDAPSS